MTEEEKAELKRLTWLKLAVDSRRDTDSAEHIIARAEKFGEYVKGESDEKSRES